MIIVKNKVGISIVYVILGVLIFLTPTVIFPVCQEEIKMNCTYTGRVEIGLGILVVLLGVISLFFSEKVRAGISMAISGIGILAIVFPVKLIGVCGSNRMKCNTATRPMLVVLGVLVILASVINAVYLLKKEEVDK